MNNKYNSLAYELKISKLNNNSFKSEDISDSENAYKFAKKFYFEDIGIFESFFIIILNKANKAIGWYKISQGGTCGTVVDIKVIAKVAVDSLASSVILVHNHLSGNVKASKEDINITNKVKNALSLFEIRLLDHLIITEGLDYYSFASDGKL